MNNGEKQVRCVQCGGQRSVADALYNMRNDDYYCDRYCFLEWADAWPLEVAEFYEDLNIWGGGH